MITGTAGELDRASVTVQISQFLQIAPPLVGAGSTVRSDFLDEILICLGVDPGRYANSYRKLETALAVVGEVYDSSNDSSESKGRTGGGTITNAGYRKLLRGLTGTPRCFILTIADHPVSTRYSDLPGAAHGFNAQVSGSRLLLQAGAGSRVVFYRTTKSSDAPKQVFFAHATVASIGEFPESSFSAFLANYRTLSIPVPAHEIAIKGWNRQHGITEIDESTLNAILVEGGESRRVVVNFSGTGDNLYERNRAIEAAILDDAEMDHFIASLAPIDEYIDLSGRADVLPEALPPLSDGPVFETLPFVPVSSLDAQETTTRVRRNRKKLDKYIEARAVNIAKMYMTENDYFLDRDCQNLGVGYDFDYSKGQEIRHLEVKGVQGLRLQFNLTSLEWSRALVDENFFIIAVTGVLKPETLRVNVVTRDILALAKRVPTQYRMYVN